jgi:hypothetical protein
MTPPLMLFGKKYEKGEDKNKENMKIKERR